MKKKFEFIQSGRVRQKRHCRCRICKRHRKFEIFLKKYSFTKNDKKWLNKIFDDLNHAEDDLDYKETILAGDWPSSVKFLTKALKRAKQKERASV